MSASTTSVASIDQVLEGAVASGAVPAVAAIAIDIPRAPEYWAGGHALRSTPRDHLRFQRMLRNALYAAR